MQLRRCFPIFSAVFVLCACKISAGNGKFDGSFFDDDASTSRSKDGGHKDAGAHKDAGRARTDAGSRSDDDGGAGGPSKAADAGGGDAGHALTADAVPGLFAEAVCGALNDCLGPVLLLDYLKGTPCVSLITQQQSDRDLHWLGESVAAGRVLLRQARFDDCLADLKAFGCAVQSRRLPQSCEDAIEGQVPLHQSCSIDYDCASDAYCDKGLQTETCPGSCVSTQSEGLPCKASNECADHLICRAGSCAALLKEADPCETSNGQPTCPPGLVCQGASGSRKCQSLGVYAGKLDESCDALGTLCEVGLVCESLTSSDTSGVCKKPVDKDADCRRAVPNECPTTQYCKSAQSGTMERALPGEVGICADLPPDGGSCSVVSCAPGTVCVNEVCRAMKAAGGICESSTECFSGDCEGGICVTALDCQL
jgi:hypothetical protein